MNSSSFQPGVKTFVFALLCALLTTKNGRQLGARILHKHIKSRLLFMLPIKVRCKIIEQIMSAPIPKGRALMSSAARPWGEQWDYITPTNNAAGHWIISPEDQLTGKLKEIEATQSDLTLYYIHGGGFRFGHSIMYMDSFIHIICYLRKRGLNVRVYSVEYRLMPEVTFEDTKQDCMDGYRYLTKTLGISANKIIVAGDSAGGNLVAGCLQHIRDNTLQLGLVLPLGNVMISPWIAIEKNATTETLPEGYVDCLTYPMLNKNHYGYFKEDSLKEPSVSPLFGSFAGFCPTLVTFGGTEEFQHDIRTLIEKLKQEGVRTAVITRPNAPHVWLMGSFLSPTFDMWEEDCTRLADWCFELIQTRG